MHNDYNDMMLQFIIIWIAEMIDDVITVSVLHTKVNSVLTDKGSNFFKAFK
jgi:hypothetical protein